VTRTAAASRNLFLRVLKLSVVVYLLVTGCAQLLSAQEQQQNNQPQYVVDRIEFVGNRRIQRDTLLARIFTRPGDPYSVEALQRDFQALWNTQFFEDIRLEVEDDPEQANGKVVVFYVTERPIIRRIQYCEGSGPGCGGLKTISESDILDAYKDKKVGLTVESPFDPTKIIRAEVIIKALLAQHGRQFATVKPTYEKIAATNAVKLVFRIDEGPKVKVGKITIVGNKAFSTDKIIRAMKHDRPYAIPLYLTFIPVMSKTFDKGNLAEDMEAGIRELYRDHGYFKVNVYSNDQDQKTVTLNKGGIPGPWPWIGSDHGKATDITIHIDEGEQYRMGMVKFVSADPDEGLIFNKDFLERAFPMKPGEIFSVAKIRKSIDDYKKLYGEYGYIDFVATPDTEFDDVKKIINVTWALDQGKEFVVRRIDFQGNTTTRDKVIRREILLDEGHVYNNRLWELSILRLNQLGFFDTIKPEDAVLTRNQKAGTVDIRLKVHEKQKQSISFSGGVSGIAGSFIGLSYQTNNFLGLGETLTVSASVGDIQKNIQFGFTEPYLFDRPISTGFTVFLNEFDYNTARQEGLLFGQQVAINPQLQENYNTDTKGFTTFVSAPIKKFSFARLGLTYGWSTTNITAFSQSAILLFEFTRFTSLAGPNALNGIRESKVTPTITYSTVNSQLNPTGGKEFYYGMSFEGGPLQGNVNSISNTFSMRYFHPNYHRRNVIGMRLMSSMITGYGGKEPPPYARFYLGGENDVRGYDFYTISPFVVIPYQTSTAVTYADPTKINSNGTPGFSSLPVSLLQFFPSRPGGDFQTVANLEYRIPIYQQYVGLSFFNDFGMNGILRPDQLQLDPSALQTLQEQYPNPLSPNLKFQSNLQLVSGTNFRPHTSAGIELVVQLPIIQAPFRIYYAYNYLRLTETIQPPCQAQQTAATCGEGGFYIDPTALAALPPGVYQTQVYPQLQTILAQQVQRIPAGLLEPSHVFRFTVSRTF
jgi:outer membrane protein insertion porin family